MNKGFWNSVQKPIFALAPMADVTDPAFRRLIAAHGKPAVMWTEFVSADGLILGGKKARNVLLRDLLHTEVERPIVAQLFTSRPDVMEKGAALVRELGFDGIDINMGCPVQKIEKQGAGAALIKTPKVAQALIAAAQRGAGSIPVSVKTRLGYNKNELDTWLPTLLEMNLAAITLHARTRREMSKVPAHWDAVKQAVALRERLQPDTLLLGNGDVITLQEAKEKVEETGCDGVMLGKAIFGNPWLFSGHVPTPREKLQALVEHIQLTEKLLPHKKFSTKHYKAYVAGWDGAKELRAKLMEANTMTDVIAIVHEYLSTM